MDTGSSVIILRADIVKQIALQVEASKNELFAFNGFKLKI